ncbi:MAG TPA: FG-GAP-like repeat-containing protein [Verrucomicrobiae bacterium]|nr:FG-GAP-like repeat-containing protein [Verrucomicrobiae bacterium]
MKTILISVTMSAVSLTSILAQPAITAQPTNFATLSAGARVSNRVLVSGDLPMTYQWRFKGEAISGQTNAIIVLTNLQPAHVGDYFVVVRNAGGALTSQVAQLNIDPAFTKITAGRVVTDLEKSWSAAWGDYDNDGFIDLLVGNNARNSLHRNNGDGTFTKITSGRIVTDSTGDALASWGDYDNDGFLDIYVGNYWSSGLKNALYHNDGNGSFTKIVTGPLVQDGPGVTGIGWGDYNNDGHLDLLVVNYENVNPLYRTNTLYRNSGDGTFARMSVADVGTIVSYTAGSRAASWVDYDGDGDLDALVTAAARNFFYRNNGNGTFTQLLRPDIGDLDDTALRGSGASWFDYDNDGDLDVFLTGGGTSELQHDAFYRNDNGKFVKLTTNQVGPVVSDGKTGFGSGAADYDNDGYVDLFVAVPSLTFSGQTGDNNLLYHNNGDGAFTRIITGSLVQDGAASGGGAWGDYNNDGFMDLVVANGNFAGAQNNFLYRNNGNTNHWIKLKLIGTTSNRGGVGAKVRVKATIRGQSFWQLRVAHDGDGEFSQHDPRPNFGLGDAPVAETVRIEWLSGIVQELHNVPVNQILTVIEPVRLQVIGPGTLEFRSWKSQVFAVEASPDLSAWSTLTTVTNTNGLIRFSDEKILSFPNRFYRVACP